MKVPLICRSCGEEQRVDLSAATGKVICPFCEHEASAGESTLRLEIETQHAKTRLFTRLAGVSALLAAALVAARVTVVESQTPDSGVGSFLWIGALALFLASTTCLVLAEKDREVVYF